MLSFLFIKSFLIKISKLILLVTFFNLLILIFVFQINLAYGSSAAIVDSNGAKTNLYFTGQSTNPNKWYQDAISTNPDVGLEICGLDKNYVGATYAIRANGIWKYVLISYKSSTDALSYADNPIGSNCYYTSPATLTFSPSRLTTPNPNVFYAAFPGRIWLAYANSANPGTLSNFVFVNESGILEGSYDVPRTYIQSINKIKVSTPTINFKSPSNTFGKLASDTNFGVNDNRRMVVGVCSDDYGYNCSGGYITPVDGNFPFLISTGLSSSEINDHHIYEKYVVINGIGNKICIGANLKPITLSVSPNPVYYGQKLRISFTISNPRDIFNNELYGGNVNVNDAFDYHIDIYNSSNSSQVVYTTEGTITKTLPVDGSVNLDLDWDAIAHSGEYTVRLTVDSHNDIKECNENDNIITTNFRLKPVFIPTIYIDKNRTNYFPTPGLPYNFSLNLMSSDGNAVSNATVMLTQQNGIDLFGPTQIWNITLNGTKKKTGLKNQNSVIFLTDDAGNAEFTVIPSGNQLLTNNGYSYLNVKSYVGDYKIYLSGKTSNNQQLVFLVNNNISDTFPLGIRNQSLYVSNKKQTIYKNNFVQQMMDYVYEIFSLFWKTGN